MTNSGQGRRRDGPARGRVWPPSSTRCHLDDVLNQVTLRRWKTTWEWITRPVFHSIKTWCLPCSRYRARPGNSQWSRRERSLFSWNLQSSEVHRSKQAVKAQCNKHHEGGVRGLPQRNTRLRFWQNKYWLMYSPRWRGQKGCRVLGGLKIIRWELLLPPGKYTIEKHPNS